jgi:hypothetical protein
MDNENQKRIYYVRESALQSIISDAVSFGFLILVMTLNFLQWGGHWYVTVFLLFLWVIFATGKASRMMQQFYTRSELVDHLIKELEEEGETSK